MILDCILTAVNEKNLYLQFVPIFIKTWNKLYPNVDVKIVLISTSKWSYDNRYRYDTNE
jgi:hypothetical protein